MEPMIILGYLLAVVVGLMLGLVGSGGSILTVPILVYILQVEPVPATAYSLFIVGVSALVGSLGYMKKGLVHYRTAMIFAVPALLAVFLTRRFLIPALPPVMLSIEEFELTRDAFIMLLFAGLMLASAVSMIRKPTGKPAKDQEEKTRKKSSQFLLITGEGVLVGTLTGLVGAGGGFMIVPALVLLGNLPMKQAVGTSLLIISIKSLTGFLGDTGHLDINWQLLIIFSALTMAGIGVGAYFNQRIPARILKKGFGWFILVMSVLIIWMETV